MIVRNEAGSTVQIERTQSAVSYAILVTFLLFVIFPFYWMIVTSFKGETQMRSLVSMFWPSPFVTENYEHLFAQDRVRELVQEQHHRVGVEHVPGHRGRAPSAPTRWPGSSSWAARSWPARC